MRMNHRVSWNSVLRYSIVSILGVALTGTATAKADTVTFWNVTAVNAIRTAGPSLGPLATPLGSRAMAMMHVAMADAVTSISPVYKPYAIRLEGHGNADQIAAASSAAYGVLVRLFPAQQSSLIQALAQSLSQVPDGKNKDEGIEVGDQIAIQIVALRSNDGSAVMMTYTPPVGLGFWQPDPRTGPSPFLSWRYVTPWTMRSPDQFRPDAPPNIYGALFAQDLAEVKEIGGISSSVRTGEQENIARFVTDNPVFQYNRLARLVAAAVPNSLEANARAFAILAMVLADEFISGYDAKFEYNFWRPWTAVQNAAAIGHPELQDSTWFSLIPTPAHPEYTANHAIQSAAIVEVLKYFYGEDVPAVTLTCEAASCPTGFTLTAGHLDDFKTLFGLARIYGGIHYRNSINLGWEQGVQIAQNAIQNFYLHSWGVGEHVDHTVNKEDEHRGEQ
jgi:hypothetical protein